MSREVFGQRQLPFIMIQAGEPLPAALRPFLEPILGNPPAQDVVISPVQLSELANVARGGQPNPQIPAIQPNQGTNRAQNRIPITLESGPPPRVPTPPVANPQRRVIGDNLTQIQASALDLVALNAANQEGRVRGMVAEQRQRKREEKVQQLEREAEQGLATIGEAKRAEASRTVQRASPREPLASSILEQQQAFPDTFTESKLDEPPEAHRAPVRAPSRQALPPERFLPGTGSNVFNPNAAEFSPTGSGFQHLGGNIFGDILKGVGKVVKTVTPFIPLVTKLVGGDVRDVRPNPEVLRRLRKDRVDNLSAGVGEGGALSDLLRRHLSGSVNYRSAVRPVANVEMKGAQGGAFVHDGKKWKLGGVVDRPGPPPAPPAPPAPAVGAVLQAGVALNPLLVQAMNAAGIPQAANIGPNNVPLNAINLTPAQAQAIMAQVNLIVQANLQAQAQAQQPP